MVVCFAKSSAGLNVVCQECQDVILKVPDERAAYCNVGLLAKHAEICSGPAKASQDLVSCVSERPSHLAYR